VKEIDPDRISLSGADSLSLAVFIGIVLWGASDQTGTGYRVPLAFESDIRSEIDPMEQFNLI
jgi:hypothetical protein